MKTILEYIINKSTKRYTIKAKDNHNLKQIVHNELIRLACKKDNYGAARIVSRDIDLNHIDVSEIYDFGLIFSQDGFYNINFDVSKWNVSNGVDFSRTFYACHGFDCDLNSWDMSKAESIYEMFSGCENFNKDLDNWETGKITVMQNAFIDCKKFNGNITTWNTEKVESTYQMFLNCEKFNQDLSNWNLENLEDMTNMFKNCKSFKQNLSKWNLARIRFYDDAFNGSAMEKLWHFFPKFTH